MKWLAAIGHERQGNKWRQIEEQDANLVSGHSTVVDDIKDLFNRGHPVAVGSVDVEVGAARRHVALHSDVSIPERRTAGERSHS